MPTATAAQEPGFRVGTHLFLRVLAATHAVAFISAWTQIWGLAGPNGILPAKALFDAAKMAKGNEAYWLVPSLCWLFGTGVFLKVMCGLGIVFAALLFAGVIPLVSLIALWILYLSLCCAGQIFFDFQWDILLLETTFVAMFLAPWGLFPKWKRFDAPKLARWMAAWLLFRLMFLSGIVKLGTGDPEWRHLRALTFHFQTQPLPTPLAWYTHHLPAWILSLACLIMFAIELLAPFGLFMPRKIRHVCVLAMIGFQILIALTGNYTFFNLLTVTLLLLFLDDRWYRRESVDANEGSKTGNIRLWMTRIAAALSIGVTSVETLEIFLPQIAQSAPGLLLGSVVDPLRSFNTYGLFAMMTTSRPELVIEGSNDGQDWKPYELPYKPGDLSKPLPFIEPFQPRLDWQLWFAALGDPNNNLWVYATCENLLKGNPDVLALFSKNPFPAHPPKFIRVIRYDYRFTDSAAHARTGQWWTRTPIDLYIPSFSLNS